MDCIATRAYLVKRFRTQDLFELKSALIMSAQYSNIRCCNRYGKRAANSQDGADSQTAAKPVIKYSLVEVKRQREMVCSPENVNVRVLLLPLALCPLPFGWFSATHTRGLAVHIFSASIVCFVPAGKQLSVMFSAATVARSILTE